MLEEIGEIICEHPDRDFVATQGLDEGQIPNPKADIDSHIAHYGLRVQEVTAEEIVELKKRSTIEREWHHIEGYGENREVCIGTETVYALKCVLRMKGGALYHVSSGKGLYYLVRDESPVSGTTISDTTNDTASRIKSFIQ